MKQYRTPARTVFQIFNFFILSLASLLCLLPFVHLLALSFSSSRAVESGFVSFWPIDFPAQSYEFAWQGGKFAAALWISVKRVLLGVTINVILMVFTAYPLSHTKEKFAGRNIYMGFFVVTMIIGGGLIPTYILVTRLGLLNSLWALVLPGALPVHNMIIMMNFMRGLPDEIEDAAVIDGAGVLQTLFRIMLPLLTPSLATVGLFQIVGHWNEWFAGLIYMQSSANYPLQTYLQMLLKNFEQLLILAQGDSKLLTDMMNAITGRAAQLFLAALPVLLVYPFLQKYFTSGLVMGSVKG